MTKSEPKLLLEDATTDQLAAELNRRGLDYLMIVQMARPLPNGLSEQKVFARCDSIPKAKRMLKCLYVTAISNKGDDLGGS